MEILNHFSWAEIKDFANSNFMTSSVGAMAGAWGGAWAAQRIASRAKARDQLLKEVRNSNFAIELAHGICSTYLNLKDQYILGLEQRFEQQFVNVHAHFQALQSGAMPPGTPLDVGGIDLQTLSPIHVRVDRLEEVVMGKLSVSGRPRPVMAVLAQSVSSLNTIINDRNMLVAALKASNYPPNIQVAVIFGLPRNGLVDMSFTDNIRNLSQRTDDCIQFSRMLCEDLAAHGEEARKEFKKRFGTEVPHIQKVIWKDVEDKGLFPSDKDYASWKSGFLRRVPKSRGRYTAKMRYFLRSLPRKWSRTRLQLKRPSSRKLGQ